MNRAPLRRSILAGLMLSLPVTSAFADVISDWNERAVTLLLAQKLGPPAAERVLAMMHLAMFDATNSVEPRYAPFLTKLHISREVSKEVAAGVAAATVLLASSPEANAPELKQALSNDLQRVPDGPAKEEGIRVGETVAAKILTNRKDDGSAAPDGHRPITTPGVYVPTPSLVVAQWPGVRPFAMNKADQFRPEPPVALSSSEWAHDFNEISKVGRFDSKSRTADQTEAAKFWISIGGDVFYPLARALIAAKKLDQTDNSRIFALIAVARADSLIAVFDAKYHYNFWRPITAIRNGDRDDNAETERDPLWRPIADTPMHPEYPCAHCVQASAMCAVLEAALGTTTFSEISMTSTTAPGAERRWTDLKSFINAVSEARVWAGFHYRFSTRVGREMGYEIGKYVVKNFLRPVESASK